nr:hypothetical protein [uncultured Draconibacterium sp.]
MKTTELARKRVAYILTVADDGIGVPVYKGEHPTEKDIPQKYITVVTGEIVKSEPNGILQECPVFVNCHVADVGPGMADYESIEVLQNGVMLRLHEVADEEHGLRFYYETEETRKNVAKGEHYSSMRFKVNFINK